MSFFYHEGIIHTKGLEIDVVDHCNLSCSLCSHMSPIWKKGFVDAQTLFTDLSILSKHLHTERLKVLGGEPLLHPDLKELLQAIYDSGIASRIVLVTNGLLLSRISLEMLNLLDEVIVSSYSSAPIDNTASEVFAELAKKQNVTFKVNEFHHFREMFSYEGSTEQALVQRVYTNCGMAHQYSCHSLYQGYFYKCPQARVIAKYKGTDALIDGIKIIEHPDFTFSIKEYLEKLTPLNACKYCLGTVGKRRKHSQIHRKDWDASMSKPYQEILDFDELQHLENSTANLTQPIFNIKHIY